MSDAAHKAYSVEVCQSVSDFSEGDWNACANPAWRSYNPFVSHGFLAALEASGSATAETGWLGQHMRLVSPEGDTVAVMPCYLKNHSQGEYVFDHGWAEAFERAGGHYYPKLQVSIPFTPASGPRILTASEPQHSAARQALSQAAQTLCERLDASSVHMTFVPEDDYEGLGELGWLQRNDTQFHWHNAGFDSFEAFLDSLSSRKRKNIRKERECVQSAGLEIVRLAGKDITEEHWDHFFRFYMDTGSRKWGQPYLTRDFFSRIGEKMADDILLIMVAREGRWIAGAINFIGGETLYGRNWGCIEDHPFLHFEVCYYQAIDFAIERGLKTVEAGAQGAHKLARGYLPVTTRSVHYIREPALRNAVANYLSHERRAIARDNQLIAQHSPFKSAGSRS